MDSKIGNAAATARESARRADGKFGEQIRPEATGKGLPDPECDFPAVPDLRTGREIPCEGMSSVHVESATAIERNETENVVEVFATHKVNGRDFTVVQFSTIDEYDGEYSVGWYLSWGFDGEDNDEKVKVLTSEDFEDFDEAMNAAREEADSAELDDLAVQDWMLQD